MPEAGRLILQKTSVGLSADAVDDLRRFLINQGLPDPTPTASAEADFHRQFEASGNSVGLHFLNALDAGQVVTDYP